MLMRVKEKRKRSKAMRCEIRFRWMMAVDVCENFTCLQKQGKLVAVWRKVMKRKEKSGSSLIFAVQSLECNRARVANLLLHTFSEIRHGMVWMLSVTLVTQFNRSSRLRLSSIHFYQEENQHPSLNQNTTSHSCSKSRTFKNSQELCQCRCTVVNLPSLYLWKHNTRFSCLLCTTQLSECSAGRNDGARNQSDIDANYANQGLNRKLCFINIDTLDSHAKPSPARGRHIGSRSASSSLTSCWCEEEAEIKLRAPCCWWVGEPQVLAVFEV